MLRRARETPRVQNRTLSELVSRNNRNKIRRPICYVNILVNGSFPFRSAHYPQSKSYPNLPLPPEGEILTKLFRMPPGCFNLSPFWISPRGRASGVGTTPVSNFESIPQGRLS